MMDEDAKEWGSKMVPVGIKLKNLTTIDDLI